jgi:hypothetical protein
MNLPPSQRAPVLTPSRHISAHGDVNRPGDRVHDMLLNQRPRDSRSNHSSEPKNIRGDAGASRGNVVGRIETERASRFAVDDVCLQPQNC